MSDATLVFGIKTDGALQELQKLLTGIERFSNSLTQAMDKVKGSTGGGGGLARVITDDFGNAVNAVKAGNQKLAKEVEQGGYQYRKALDKRGQEAVTASKKLTEEVGKIEHAAQAKRLADEAAAAAREKELAKQAAQEVREAKKLSLAMQRQDTWVHLEAQKKALEMFKAHERAIAEDIRRAKQMSLAQQRQDTWVHMEAKKKASEMFKLHEAAIAEDIRRTKKQSLIQQGRDTQAHYEREKQMAQAQVATLTRIRNEAASFKSVGLNVMGQAPIQLDPRMQSAMTRLQNKGTEDAAKSIKQMGDNAKAAKPHLQGLTDVSRDLHSAARGLAGSFGATWLTWGNTIPLAATAALGASLRQAIKLGGELEYQLTFVKALSGATSEQVGQMETLISRQAQSGLFGPAELANGLRILAQAGLNTNEALYTLATTTQLATVGEMTMAQAALNLVGVMNAFNLSVTDVSHIGNVFAKAAAVSQTSVASMTESMKTASVAGAMYGATMEDTATALTTLAKLNITGTAAGTSFRNMLKEIYAPSKGVAEVWKQMGVAAHDAMGNARPFADVIYDLKGKLQEFDKISQIHILQKLFGERGAKEAIAMLAMTREEWDKLKASIKESDGFAARVSAELEQTAKGQFIQAFNTLKVTLVEAFKATEPEVKKLAVAMKELFGSPDFVAAVTQMVKLMVNLATAVVELTHVVIPAGAAWLSYSAALTAINFARVVQGITAVGSAAAIAGIALNPWAAAIAVVVGALTLLWMHQSGGAAADATQKAVDQADTASVALRKEAQQALETEAAYNQLSAARTGGGITTAADHVALTRSQLEATQLALKQLPGRSDSTFERVFSRKEADIFRERLRLKEQETFLTRKLAQEESDLAIVQAQRNRDQYRAGAAREAAARAATSGGSKTYNAGDAEELKKIAQARQTLTEKIQDYILATEKEIAQSKDLTQAQKLESEAQKEYKNNIPSTVQALIDKALATEKVRLAQEAFTKSSKEMREAQGAFLTSMVKENEALDDKIKKQKLALEQVGQTIDTKKDLEAAMLNEEALLADAAAQVYGYAAAWAEAERMEAEFFNNPTKAAEMKEAVVLYGRLQAEAISKASKLRESALLAEQTGAKKAAFEAAKDSAQEWNKFADDIERALTDSLMRGFESGKSFGRNFIDSLKNMLKTAALKLVVQAIVDPIMGTVRGMTGGGPGRAGTLNTGNSLMNAGSNVLSLFGNGGSGVPMASGFGAFADTFNGAGLGRFAQSSFGQSLGLSSESALGGLQYSGVGSVLANLPIGGMLTAYTQGGVGGFASGVGSTALAGGISSMAAGGGFMSGAAGALTSMGPWGWAALAAMAILGGMGKSTPHKGGMAEFSAAGGLTTGKGVSIYDTHSGFGGKSAATDAQGITAATAHAQGIVGMLDSTAGTFGLTGGYKVATGFADDSSSDGAWGALQVSNASGKVLDWGDTRTSKWAPKEFSDGKAGAAQYTAALAQSTLQIFKDMDLPEWADNILDSIGSSPSLETIQQAVTTINAMKPAADKLIELGIPIEQITPAAIQAAGGLENVLAMLEALPEITQNAQGAFEEARLSNMSASESYAHWHKEATTAAKNFDGSTRSAQKLATAVQNRYQAELEMLRQIDAAIQAIDTTFAQARDRITLDTLDASGQYDFWDQRADTMLARIQNSTDPAVVQAAGQEYANAVMSGWALLSHEQQIANRDAFLAALDLGEDAVDDQLDSIATDLATDNEAFATLLKDSIVDAITTGFQRVADAQTPADPNAGGGSNNSGTQEPLNLTINIPGVGTYQTSISKGRGAEVGYIPT